MITNALLKDIKSLQLKKNRQQQQCFFVEGAKSVIELIHSDYKIKHLLGTNEFINKYSLELGKVASEFNEITEKQLTSIGTFKSNDMALAVAEIKPNIDFTKNNVDQLILVLDDVRDPGNLGTIVRIADWYGINKIVASETTADFYNPKVISSTMGSFTRVKVYYTNLIDYLKDNTLPVYGAFMDGENVHNLKLARNGYLIMGNEANGISHELEKHITNKITIPKYGNAESLNVAIATAIICDNFYR